MSPQRQSGTPPAPPARWKSAIKSFHPWTWLQRSTRSVCSQFLWRCLASATYGKCHFLHLQEQSVRHTSLESDYQLSGLWALWTRTGKSELLLKGKFRGWINLRAVWSVKWSCRAIFSKISFIRYELLYLRPIWGRRLDETPRGPSFHSVIYIQVFDWKIVWKEFVAVGITFLIYAGHYVHIQFYTIIFIV